MFLGCKCVGHSVKEGVIASETDVGRILDFESLTRRCFQGLYSKISAKTYLRPVLSFFFFVFMSANKITGMYPDSALCVFTLSLTAALGTALGFISARTVANKGAEGEVGLYSVIQQHSTRKLSLFQLLNCSVSKKKGLTKLKLN